MFDSPATNLVPGDANGRSDVFLHDLHTGVTERVSQTPAGVGGDGHSTRADISDDGQWVVFTSSSTNLGWNGGNAQDVLVWNRLTKQITPVSWPRGDDEDFVGVQSPPRISGDGSTVVWVSDDDSLPGDNEDGVRDAFTWDRQSGVIELVSRGPADAGGTPRQADYHTDGIAAVSADGSEVAFESRASNLVDGVPGRPCCLLSSDVFLWSRFGDETTVELVGRTHDGRQDSGASDPAVSPGGDEVVFVAGVSPIEGVGGSGDVFRWDADAPPGEEYSWVSRPPLGSTHGNASHPEITGGAIVFVSDDPQLSATTVDDNDATDVFRVAHGAVELVSTARDGTSGDDDSGRVDVSLDGDVVAFASRASDLVAGDGNATQDVFVRTYE
ncbi:hypothetical protein [Nocardioides sp. TF02-7]|uniref:TolB family protein n=1 Tax=Nocardioides sp. TF02-7 TaxID=2917724 RepID=UPI001F06215C|nr:hypothetical protein [Nocardioides sp. TF02-7]UMG94423.1 hypothetical protein MF408_10810 [Nocardioides sp. TF02-7]